MSALVCIPFFLFASLLNARGQDQPMKTKRTPFSCVFISDARIASLKEAVSRKQSPTDSTHEACRVYAEENLDRVPTTPKKWYIPGFYRDAEAGCDQRCGAY